MKEMIDLRSDTVTKPSAAMLEFMMKAVVGDDVFGEDPTVQQLEAMSASMFGKEAALFCSSGVMSNQIAIRVHTRPGDEVICDFNSHIYHYETGGVASNSGVQIKLIQGDRGRINVNQLEQAINADYDWLPRTRLVSLENTVNRAGGSVYSLSEMQNISKWAEQKKLALHLDGARIFNAIEETKYSTEEVGKLFNSISICLSKGLGAPIGSLLIGDKNYIKEARRVRKSMGGGMRQVGYLAAAGIFALENNRIRLKDDHYMAKELGKTLMQCRYVKEVLPVDTNIVIFHLPESILAKTLEEKLLEEGIRCAQFGKHTIRFVTHLDFTMSMLDKTIEILKKIKI
jgi:threonine aldolase